ncbi:hypothetical protein FACS189462_2770 [Spirochaetia bacterium]|nr:hypothetical protein FACS189462_2770 [Spirochaetia bacterium]
MAKGIEAEQSGKIPAALFYYSRALYFDANSAKAKNKQDALSAKVKSGDPWGLQGNEAQKKIELRKRWPALGEESRQFFTENPPVLSLLELAVTPVSLTQEKLDYNKETATYRCRVNMRTAGNRAALYVDDVLRDGWENTGIGGKFPVDGGPLPDKDTAGYSIWIKLYTLEVELVNGDGKTIATSPVPPKSLRIFQSEIMPNGDDAQFYASVHSLGFYKSSLDATYGGISGTTGDSSYSLSGHSGLTADFTFVVSVNDITDKGMRVRIKKVYEYGLSSDRSYTTATLLRTLP